MLRDTQSHCNHVYPHLKRIFGQTLLGLNTRPLVVKTTIAGGTKRFTVRIKGAEFADMVRSFLYVTPVIKYIPALIEDAAHAE